jgi:hypothetical protein
VKNERRQRVDNVPYGKWNETVMAALYPANHPYHWPVFWSMADLSVNSGLKVDRINGRLFQVVPASGGR